MVFPALGHGHLPDLGFFAAGGVAAVLELRRAYLMRRRLRISDSLIGPRILNSYVDQRNRADRRACEACLFRGSEAPLVLGSLQELRVPYWVDHLTAHLGEILYLRLVILARRVLNHFCKLFAVAAGLAQLKYLAEVGIGVGRRDLQVWILPNVLELIMIEAIILIIRTNARSRQRFCVCALWLRCFDVTLACIVILAVVEHLSFAYDHSQSLLGQAELIFLDYLRSRLSIVLLAARVDLAT